MHRLKLILIMYILFSTQLIQSIADTFLDWVERGCFDGILLEYRFVALL
jgi:hypothetical protein